MTTRLAYCNKCGFCGQAEGPDFRHVRHYEAVMCNYSAVPVPEGGIPLWDASDLSIALGSPDEYDLGGES